MRNDKRPQDLVEQSALCYIGYRFQCLATLAASEPTYNVWNDANEELRDLLKIYGFGE